MGSSAIPPINVGKGRKDPTRNNNRYEALSNNESDPLMKNQEDHNSNNNGESESPRKEG
jgi:hypothetical protein